MTPLLYADQSAPGGVCLGTGPLWHLRAANYTKKSDAELYVSPTSFIVPWLLGTSVANIPVVHDLIAFQSEPHNKKAKAIERVLLKRVTETASHICTVSESTSADLCTRFPVAEKKATAIFAGPMQTTQVTNESETKKTIVCIGTLCPRKNQLRLIEAYRRLPEHLRNEYELVLVGARGWNDQQIVDLAKSTDGVTWLNYVPDDEYKHILSTATVFAFPSLYEGFGMAVLDALARGIPVLCSNKGSLAEVAGQSAKFVDPESIESITEGLEAVLLDKQLQFRLREMGPPQASKFSWAKTVDLFLEAASSVLQ